MKRLNPKLPRLTALSLAIALASSTGYAAHHENEGLIEAKPTAQHPSPRAAGHGAKYTESATRNAWLHGKLETTYLLNRHLNNFSINSKVVDGKAVLDGTVESEIDKNLAKEVALGIEGITEVENNLTIDQEQARDQRNQDDMDAEGRSFAQRIDDATTTASVKSQLLMNGNTSGLAVNVDTRNNVVTLSGDVDSAEEKALAGQIAENTNDVRAVQNQLVIEPEDEQG